MCTYLSLILSAVLAVLHAHAQEKNTSAQICKYLLLTGPIVHSYVLCIISQPWYCKTIACALIYHVSTVQLVHPQAKHTLSAQLCGCLAQLCIVYHGLCSVIVVCTISWENESLQLYNFMAF